MGCLLISSDWHLNTNSRDAYRIRWVQTALPDMLRRLEVTEFVFLGDLTDQFDNHSSGLVNLIVEVISSIASRCSVYLLRGNHDYTNPDHPFFKFTQVLNNVRWINEPTRVGFADIGRALFLPHTRDHKTDWAEVDFRGVDLIFAHNTFKGALSDTGSELDGIPPGVLPRDVPVISGDVHAPFDGRITYVGSPYTTVFGCNFTPRVIAFKKGKQLSIPCTGTQKRLVEAIDIDQAISKLASARGDIVRLRIGLDTSKRDDWPAIKQRAQAEALRLGVELHSTEPILDKPAAAKRRYKVKSTQRDDEIIKAYCKDQDVPEPLEVAALRIAKLKG